MTQALSRAPTTRCTRSCSCPRLGRIEREVRRHDEQRDFGKIRRAFGRQVAQPGVIAVAETDAVGFLDQFDPVEDSAPHIGGPLEGIAAGAGDDERLLARLQPAGQPVVAVVAEQTAADGRHRDVARHRGR